MNIIRWVKSLFSPKIPSEYYDLEMTEDYRFTVAKRHCNANDDISVLRWKLDKKFGATTNLGKTNRLYNRINAMNNEYHSRTLHAPAQGQCSV